MDKILLSSSVDSVVQLLNGFAGEVLIFVSHVIRDKFREIMCQERKRMNCLNVEESGIALSKWTIHLMEMNTHWAALCAETQQRIRETFDNC